MPQPEREGRRQVVVDAAQRTDGGGRVDQDPAGAHRQRVGVHDVVVAGVDGRGVAQATVLGDQHGRVDGVLDVVGRAPARAPASASPAPADARRARRGRTGSGASRILVSGADGEPGPRRQLGRLLAERAMLTLSPQPKANSASASASLGGQQVGAHPLELGDHLVVDLVVDDAGLLGRADHRRVEGLGDQDVDDRALRGRRVRVDVDRARCPGRRSGRACRRRWPGRRSSGRR